MSRRGGRVRKARARYEMSDVMSDEMSDVVYCESDVMSDVMSTVSQMTRCNVRCMSDVR